MTQQVRAAVIIGGGLVAAAVIVLVAVLIARDNPPPAPAAGAGQVRVLPDGSTATAAQEAYLDAVEPHLSPQYAADSLGVLSSGESFCSVWLHPSSPDAQQQGAQLLMDASGYNQSEAAAIASAAAEHLCPDK